MTEIITKSADETRQYAKDFAKDLKKGNIVALIGELGAGKTSFVQGLAEGLSVPAGCYVCSPTFTILKVYRGTCDIFHFDFYRLESPEEFEDLGFQDYLNAGGITVIEWADKFIYHLPKNMIRISFEVLGENDRRIRIEEEVA